MPDVYHLLPEAEIFSEFAGGAISRWVANVLRNDMSGVVVACSSDLSWGFDAARIIDLPALTSYHCLHPGMRRRMPWMIRKLLLRRVLRPLTSLLTTGDVVWVHNRPEFAAAIGEDIRAAGARLVLHMHNSHLLTANPKIVRDLQLDGSVFVSRYLKEETCEKYPAFLNGTVLYNGADERLFFPATIDRPVSSRPVTVIFASRIVPEKGPDILSEALRLLMNRGVPVQGIIVGGAEFGKSEPTGYIKDLYQRAPSNLQFHSYCTGEQLANLFREADIFCLPSTWQDPFPLAPLEAMATGLPVVALAYGGGILVERGSVEELASAIEALVADPILRMNLARQSLLSFLQHFGWPTVVQNYQAIVKSTAGHALEHVSHA
jgi:glycosyltransferase involved in cell wall biosynthesis